MHALLLLALSLTIIDVSLAVKFDFLNHISVQVRVGDTILSDGSQGQDSSNHAKLYDENLETGIQIPDSLPDEQYIEVDMTAYKKDEPFTGIWLHTDETLMTSGTITFTVDGVECPHTNQVGVDAIGGAFNCDLMGRSLTIRCTDTCSPNFAVNELHVYDVTILSAIPTGNAYPFTGNV